MMPNSNVVADIMKYSDWITLGIGLAAFVGTILSNIIAYRAVKSNGKQRIADYRKEWIENLRVQLAEFDNLSNQRAVLQKMRSQLESNPIHQINEELKLENMKEFNTAFERCRAVNSYVVLMLNPNEEDHKKLSGILGDLLSTMEPSAEKLFELRHISQTVLKTEWDRLKIELN